MGTALKGATSGAGPQTRAIPPVQQGQAPIKVEAKTQFRTKEEVQKELNELNALLAKLDRLDIPAVLLGLIGAGAVYVSILQQGSIPILTNSVVTASLGFAVIMGVMWRVYRKGRSANIAYKQIAPLHEALRAELKVIEEREQLRATIQTATQKLALLEGRTAE